MPNTLLRHLPLLFALLLGPVWAEKADRQKPMQVEADNMRYDDGKQTNVFSGKVLVNKGTIVIRGARLEVRQDPQGNQFGRITAEPGQRAFFRQKREGVDEFIEAEAETIDYDGKADTVRFTQRAELRRYRGTQVADVLNGAVIVYDNTTEMFTVDGGAASGQGGGRVRATLTPKSAASAPGGDRR